MTQPEDKNNEVEETPEAEVEVDQQARADEEAARAAAAAEEAAAAAEEAPTPTVEAAAAEAEELAEKAEEAAEAAAEAPKPKRARKAREAEQAADQAEEAADEAVKSAKRSRSRRRKPEEPKAVPVGLKVSAQAKYVRTSARKARLVCDHIRGKDVTEARAILAFTTRGAAEAWIKLLESAVANAEHNHELLGEDLRIEKVHADEGPTLKRYRPRAMGRATRIRKRTSHLSITLTPKES
jgi:ribosomal protein L22